MYPLASGDTNRNFMKNKFSFPKKNYTVFLMAFLYFPLFGQTTPEECEYEIFAEINHVDCRANGEIKITLVGPDIGNMPNKEYKIYKTGENGDAVLWSTSNVFVGLTEGNYTVESKAHCTKNDINITRSITNVIVNRLKEYEDPRFRLISSRKTLSCVPTGTLRVSGINTGEKGPFRIEIEDSPVEYNGITTLYQGETIDENYTFEGFPKGEYTVTLYDGCEASTSETVTVEELSSDFYSQLIYNYILSPRYENATNPTCTNLMIRKFNTALGSSNDFYEYFNNWHLYYEYAFYLPSETPESLPSDRWKTMDGSTTYLHYETTTSLKEIRENKSTLVPRIAFRVKGGNGQIKTHTPVLLDPYLSVAQNNTECGKRNVGLHFATTTSTSYSFAAQAVICYPYIWHIIDRGSNDTVASYTEPVDTYSILTSNYVELTPGIYTAVAIDNDGYQIQSNFTVAETNSINTSLSSKTLVNNCTLYDSISVSFSGSSNAPLAGATFVFDRANTDSRIPTPAFGTSITLPDDFSSNSFYPWSENNTLAGNYLEWRQLPLGSDAIFSVTDACGITKTIRLSKTLTSSDYRFYQYFFDTDAEWDIDVSCSWAKLTPTNLKDVIKYYQELTGGSLSNPINNVSYLKVMATPDDATVVYHTNSEYCSSLNNSDCVYLSKSGKYTIRVARSADFTSNYVCYRDYEIDIEVPEFSMNEEISTGYRCPDDASSGFMQIKVNNGSGNFLYELFKKDDIDNPIDHNNTGIFTSWAGVTPDDTLVVKVTDIDCQTSFTQRMGIYDLNNATIAWVEGSLRKCVGDIIYLHALPLGEDAVYEWKFPNGTISNLQHPVIDTENMNISGDICLKVSIQGCSDTYVYDTVRISVAENLMYWNPDAENANWHERDNWLVYNNGVVQVANAVPGPCTTVHIAGNAKTYPNLDMSSTPRTIDGVTLGYPACDTIIYHYGSETVFPNYLNYSRAKVQYNFGYYDMTTNPQFESQPVFNKDREEYVNSANGNSFPRMERARYYMISSPLKHVTGGDFGLAGYPQMYQKLYNTERPGSGFASRDRFTRTFSSLIQNLEKTGHAMALLAPDYYDYVGWRDHSHLESLKGVIEIPFYMDNNPEIMGYHQQEYDEITSTSTFQYYDPDKLEPIQKWDKYIRNYQGYRFVYENENDTVSLGIDLNGERVAMYEMELKHINDDSNTHRVLIGNPLMCHLDFNMLYANNRDVIMDHYWLVDEDETFYSYRAWETPDNPNSISKDIAPLQGFVIEVLPETQRTRNSLLLPLEGDSCVITRDTTGLAKPKTAPVDIRSATTGRKGWLSVYGITPPVYSTEEYPKDSIRIRSSVLFNYDVVDIPKLILGDANTDTRAETFLSGLMATLIPNSWKIISLRLSVSAWSLLIRMILLFISV